MQHPVGANLLEAPQMHLHIAATCKLLHDRLSYSITTVSAARDDVTSLSTLHESLLPEPTWLIITDAVGVLQGLPVAEVNVTAGSVSVAFDDSHSEDCDASNTHLKLRGQKFDMLLELMDDSIATKVGFELCWECKSIYCVFNNKKFNLCSSLFFAIVFLEATTPMRSLEDDLRCQKKLIINN